MCDIVFEKTKSSGGTVNRTSVYGKAFFKKEVMRNFTKFSRKHLCQNVFLGVFLSVLRDL